MSLSLRQTLTLCFLVVSTALLSSLIPGGPIENRDFGHLGVTAVLSFNIFLAALIFASIVAIVLTWKGSHSGSRLAFVSGLGYASVYLLDLLEIFPTSPTAMSEVLYSVEVTGLIVAGLLMAASHSLTINNANAGNASAQPKSISLPVPFVFLILAMSVGIIAFATVSALGL